MNSIADNQFCRGGWGPGRGNVWASLQKNGSVRFGFAPPDWRGGAKFASIKETDFKVEDMTNLKSRLDKKWAMANALHLAETGDMPDKQISRIEAKLAELYHEGKHPFKDELRPQNQFSLS